MKQKAACTLTPTSAGGRSTDQELSPPCGFLKLPGLARVAWHAFALALIAQPVSHLPQ